MDSYKRQLMSHAGFYFCVTGIAYLLFRFGLSGWLWLDAAYLVVGYFAAFVMVGNLNLFISQRFEQRANAEYGDMTLAEAIEGSDRTEMLRAQGSRLGTLITVVAIAVGFATVYAYDLLLPR